MATIATVNDVHFGETISGHLGGRLELLGRPVLGKHEGKRYPLGDRDYPDVMNRAIVQDILAANPDAVLVKGDLTSDGNLTDFERFKEIYGVFGDKLHVVRGNHDAKEIEFATGPQVVELPGVVCVMLDTSLQYEKTGQISKAQLALLRDVAAGTDKMVMVFGHHEPRLTETQDIVDKQMGINEADSRELAAIIRSHENIVGYFAGHTHRNRVNRPEVARGVPIGEVGATTEFPGVWAKYDIHDDGSYIQTVHRVTDPEANKWVEHTRAQFRGLQTRYALGKVADRCFNYP